MLTEPVDTPDEPPLTAEPQPPVAVMPASDPAGWTASASAWSEPTGQPGMWGAQPPLATTPTRPRGNRTLWIILAIVGFLIFCCCGFLFVALLIDGTTSAATSDLSVVRYLPPA
jgi:hypothetical protein